MKAKKTKKADVDRLRHIFFKAGLSLSLIAVAAAFNWTVYDRKSLTLDHFNPMDIEEEWADIIHVKKEIKKPEQIEIKIVNEEVEPDKNLLDLLNQDAKETDSVLILPINEVKEIINEDPYEFWKVEKKPAYPGGDEARFKFLAKHLSYPEPELTLGIHGTVHLHFIINADGSLSNIEVVKGLTPNLDAEAIRVMKMMPKWIPGYQREKAVAVTASMGIRFTIGN